MKREQSHRQSLYGSSRVNRLIGQRFDRITKQRQEHRMKNQDRKQWQESPIEGSSWWIYFLTIVLLLFLGFLLFLIMYHIFYRVRLISNSAKLYNTILKIRPYVGCLKKSYWDIHNKINDLFGMNDTNEETRLAIATAVRSVLTPLGIASIMLGYINSAKSKEVAGFSLSVIIERRYPCRIAFYCLQGLFVLLGIYTAARGWLFSATLCLLGALICFVYSVFLAYRVLISQRLLLHSTRCYIDSRIKLARCRAKRSGRESQQLYNDIVFLSAKHVSKYLNQRYLSGDLFRLERNHVQIDFCYLAFLLDRLWLGSSKMLNGREEGEKCAPTDCVSSFSAYFAPEPTGNTTDLEYAVLYNLPITNTNTELFCRGIRSCQELWELLLDPVKDLRQRAALAKHQLYIAVDQCHNYPLLLCGLAAYMWARFDPTKKSTEKESANGECELFFRYLTYGQPEPAMMSYEVTSKTESRFKVACGELAFLLMCLLTLMDALSDRGNKGRDVQSFCETIKNVYLECCPSGHIHNTVYLAYASLIFDTLNLRPAPRLTWLELNFSLHMIRQQLETLL